MSSLKGCLAAPRADKVLGVAVAGLEQTSSQALEVLIDGLADSAARNLTAEAVASKRTSG